MISNSSPLIIFSKLNKLDLLKKVLGEIMISEAVYEEVVRRGGEVNAPDSLLVKDYFDQGNIEVKKLEGKWKKKAVFLKKVYQSLDYGESETICLALQEKEKIILIDEKIARKVAKIYDIDSIGSLGVLLLAFRRKLLNERRIREIINEMIRNEFRLGAELINEFWEQLDEFKKNNSD